MKGEIEQMLSTYQRPTPALQTLEKLDICMEALGIDMGDLKVTCIGVSPLFSS